jgi:hypothetical protein
MAGIEARGFGVDDQQDLWCRLRRALVAGGQGRQFKFGRCNWRWSGRCNWCGNDWSWSDWRFCAQE